MSLLAAQAGLIPAQAVDEPIPVRTAPPTYEILQTLDGTFRKTGVGVSYAPMPLSPDEGYSGSPDRAVLVHGYFGDAPGFVVTSISFSQNAAVYASGTYAYISGSSIRRHHVGAVYGSYKQ